MGIDKRHGGPYDRGGADFYYSRIPAPHYYVSGTYVSERIERDGMSPKDIEDYIFGYSEAAKSGVKKVWD
tara:strand:+ start:3277 stop:3486 length:210 start_codon:yes stop_codon:yes gene_type:complete